MQGSHARRARIVARLSLVGAVLSLLAAFTAFTPVPRASAAPSGSLTTNPGNTSINVGDSISFTLDVVGGANISEVDVTLTYNPVVVQVVDADSGAGGTQILPGAFPGTTLTGSVLVNDASAGTLQYRYALNSGQASGNGTIATVQFKAIAVGNANLAWSAKTFTDASQATNTPPSSVSQLAVGQAVPTSTPSPTPVATDTALPADTPTPGATGTPSPTTTGTPQPTDTPTETETPGASATPGSATPTRTPTAAASSTPGAATNTPAATSTPRITVIDKPPQSSGGGVDPAQANRAAGLPSAGNNAPGTQWWRWIFFLAAIMLGIAGWFFTFAIHYGDKDPVLIDRHDRRRRRKY